MARVRRTAKVGAVARVGGARTHLYIICHKLCSHTSMQVKGGDRKRLGFRSEMGMTVWESDLGGVLSKEGLPGGLLIIAAAKLLIDG